MEVFDLIDGHMLVAKNDLGPNGKLLDIVISSTGLQVQFRLSVDEAKALRRAIGVELPEILSNA